MYFCRGDMAQLHEYHLLVIWNFIESKLERFENHATAIDAYRAFARAAERYHLSADYKSDPTKWLSDDCSFAEDEDYLIEVLDIRSETSFEELREEYVSLKTGSRAIPLPTV
jgi:hypothetical protein